MFENGCRQSQTFRVLLCIIIQFMSLYKSLAGVTYSSDGPRGQYPARTATCIVTTGYLRRHVLDESICISSISDNATHTGTTMLNNAHSCRKKFPAVTMVTEVRGTGQQHCSKRLRKVLLNEFGLT